MQCCLQDLIIGLSKLMDMLTLLLQAACLPRILHRMLL